MKEHGYRDESPGREPQMRRDASGHQPRPPQEKRLGTGAGDSNEAAAREPAAAEPSSPGADEEPLLEESHQRSDITQLKGLHRPISISAAMLVCLVVLASVYFLYFAKQLVLPILFAVVLNFLLNPVVRSLHRLRIPRPVIAATLLICLAAAVLVGGYTLSGPAQQFVEMVPAQLREFEYEMRGLVQPVEQMQETARQVEETTGGDEQEVVAVQGPGLITTAMSYAQSFGAGLLVAGILLLFLLSLDEIFLHKLVYVLPTIHDKRLAVEVVRQIEQDVSRYLLTVTLINAALGAATALVLGVIGVPSPILWGVAVALLNYVPYLGPCVAIVLLALVGLVSFESIGRAALPPLAFFGLNLLEAYVLTPVTLGKRLNLNPVMIFLSLAFFGFLWGVAGMLLAVPLLVTVKVVSDHIQPLSSISTFLSGPET